jgi:hypothetical protein
MGLDSHRLDVVPHESVPGRRVLDWVRRPELRESVLGDRRTADVSAGRVALQKLMSGVWFSSSRRRKPRGGEGLAEGLRARVKSIDVSERTSAVRVGRALTRGLMGGRRPGS